MKNFLLLLLIMIGSFSCNHSTKSKPPKSKNINFAGGCYFEMCFTKPATLIDSSFSYTKKSEDVNNSETMYYVFDTGKTDSTLILQQCKTQNYSSLPIQNTHIYAVESHLKDSDKGYYKELNIHSYQRYLIYNQTQQKFIIFQIGTHPRNY